MYTAYVIRQDRFEQSVDNQPLAPIGERVRGHIEWRHHKGPLTRHALNATCPVVSAPNAVSLQLEVTGVLDGQPRGTDQASY
jgi:hypothetical protein